MQMREQIECRRAAARTDYGRGTKKLEGWFYFQVSIVSSFDQSLPLKRITVGPTSGGILRVASVAERVLSKRGGRAPGCWRRACPALGGVLAIVECWRGCSAVLEPVAVGAGAGLRVLRASSLTLPLGLALRVAGWRTKANSD